jgi:hypothetical protein
MMNRNAWDRIKKQNSTSLAEGVNDYGLEVLIGVMPQNKKVLTYEHESFGLELMQLGPNLSPIHGEKTKNIQLDHMLGPSHFTLSRPREEHH